MLFTRRSGTVTRSSPVFRIRQTFAHILAVLVLLFGCASFNCFVHAAAVPEIQIEAFEYMKAKNYAKALDCYSTALKEKPPNSWQILVNMGSCYSGLGDYDKALSCLTDSINIGGLHPTQCVNLSAVYQKLGDNNKALSWLN